MFQLFLDEIAIRNPKQINVLILDNAAFHKAKKLKIPDNIVLIFQPPYSPELNLAENMWEQYKRNFTNKVHQSLDVVLKFIQNFTRTLKPKSIMKTTAFSYVIFDQ